MKGKRQVSVETKSSTHLVLSNFEVISDSETHEQY